MNNITEISPLQRPERKATLKFGQRHLSMMSLAVIIIIVFGFCVGMYSMYIQFKITRDLSITDSNLHALSKAMYGFAMDNDEHLPKAEEWTDQVTGYLSAPPDTPGGKLAYLRGEDEHGHPIHYIYNDLAGGLNLDPANPKKDAKTYDLSRLVLLLEAPGEGRNEHARIPPRNTPEGEEALAKLLKFPHNADDPAKATTVVLYANGNTERITRKDVEK